ncbi:MAG TPA: hypothetical protein IAD34_09260 [Candidatus Scatovicinus merdipullorum]|nr:hypothetical protein [Candidatus Scatovicinus merdipullorum]
MNLKEMLGDAYKEGMTFEEVESALESVTIPEDNSAEIERLKNALSKSNSEAAGYKKQLREKMTEDEQKKQKEQEEREELQNKYDKLLRESVISKNKAKLVALGYEEILADETAEAMADGDTEKVFANQQKHLASFEKKVRADALKKTPKPTPEGDSKTMTLEKFRKLNPTERHKFYTEHPEEYKELYGGNE